MSMRKVRGFCSGIQQLHIKRGTAELLCLCLCLCLCMKEATGVTIGAVFVLREHSAYFGLLMNDSLLVAPKFGEAVGIGAFGAKRTRPLPKSPAQLCLVVVAVVAASISISRHSGPLPVQLSLGLLLHLSLSNTNGERNGMPMVNGTCSFFSCVTHSTVSLLCCAVLCCVVFDRYIEKTKSQSMKYI